MSTTVTRPDVELLAILQRIERKLDVLLERVREQFPNDAEVSAAIDRFLVEALKRPLIDKAA